ncbi:UDP-glycosyltransferase 83A1-like [Mercurialis annua]|uniref:UDP-glycosyltransferase 83A1-like n=1 Tax=Mercurialis annua TaxID=3986 RepID=UPI0024AD29B1|nr:UDP-glycosyltransferase 83A1-like [Mercurialis annua]
MSNSNGTTKPHVILIPYPAQGHVAPLMKLAYNLASHGIKVTFVNTESIHMKITSAMSQEITDQCPINLVAVPDGWESNPGEEEKWESIENAPKCMRAHLQNLIENINRANNDAHVTYVIADIVHGWALEVAKKMCIKTGAFVPYGLGNLALMLHAPKLDEAGIIDFYGKHKYWSLTKISHLFFLCWSICSNTRSSQF